MSEEDRAIEARDIYVFEMGMKPAAWLLRTHRRRLRKRGGVVFFHRLGAKEEPGWFVLAVEYLAKFRRTKWEVKRWTKDGTRWTTISKAKREVPEAIRPS
jgi:hypothetical protein